VRGQSGGVLGYPYRRYRKVKVGDKIRHSRREPSTVCVYIVVLSVFASKMTFPGLHLPVMIPMGHHDLVVLASWTLQLFLLAHDHK
jgi:hypothetical protein